MAGKLQDKPWLKLSLWLRRPLVALILLHSSNQQTLMEMEMAREIKLQLDLILSLSLIPMVLHGL